MCYCKVAWICLIEIETDPKNAPDSDNFVSVKNVLKKDVVLEAKHNFSYMIATELEGLDWRLDCKHFVLSMFRKLIIASSPLNKKIVFSVSCIDTLIKIKIKRTKDKNRLKNICIIIIYHLLKEILSKGITYDDAKFLCLSFTRRSHGFLVLCACRRREITSNHLFE